MATIDRTRLAELTRRELARFAAAHPRSHELSQRAKESLIGGRHRAARQLNLRAGRAGGRQTPAAAAASGQTSSGPSAATGSARPPWLSGTAGVGGGAAVVG